MALFPPAIVPGAIVAPVNAAGVIINDAVRLVPLRKAFTVPVVVLDWPVVETVNVALDAPAGIVMLAGTVAFDDIKVIAVPPVGAGRDNAIVPATELPPTTVAGVTLTPESSGISTVRVPVTDPPKVAVTMADTLVGTMDVVTENVA